MGDRAPPRLWPVNMTRQFDKRSWRSEILVVSSPGYPGLAVLIKMLQTPVSVPMEQYSDDAVI